MNKIKNSNIEFIEKLKKANCSTLNSYYHHRSETEYISNKIINLKPLMLRYNMDIKKDDIISDIRANFNSKFSKSMCQNMKRNIYVLTNNNINDNIINYLPKFENNKKLKSESEIKSALIDCNNIIKNLEKILKEKKNQLLILKYFSEKNEYRLKLLHLKKLLKFVNNSYQSKIKNLQKKQNNMERKLISKKILDEEIYKEEINFQCEKVTLLNNLVEYRILLSQINNTENEMENNKINDYYSNDNRTIKEYSSNDYSKLDSSINDSSAIDENIYDQNNKKIQDNKISEFKYKFFDKENLTNLNN